MNETSVNNPEIRANALRFVLDVVDKLPPTHITEEDIVRPMYSYFNTIFSLSDLFYNYLTTGVADLSNLEDAPESKSEIEL